MPFANTGATVDMKWGSRKSLKVYEAEILKISGKSLACLTYNLSSSRLTRLKRILTRILFVHGFYKIENG